MKPVVDLQDENKQPNPIIRKLVEIGSELLLLLRAEGGGGGEVISQHVLDRVNRELEKGTPNSHAVAYALGGLTGAAIRDGLTDIPDSVIDAVCADPQDVDRIYAAWRDTR